MDVYVGPGSLLSSLLRACLSGNKSKENGEKQAREVVRMGTRWHWIKNNGVEKGIAGKKA